MKAKLSFLAQVVFASLLTGQFAFAQFDGGASIVTTTKYQDSVQYLEKLHTQYPQNTEMFDLGLNDDGIMIKGIKIGNGPLKNLVVGTHHGNEFGSTEVAKGFAASLAAAPIAGQTLFVIPVLNVNGYNSRQRYENLHGQYMDSNRDYPGPCINETPFMLKSTSALDALVQREEIVTAATLHTFHPAVLYPWGMSTSDWQPPYMEIWEALVTFATKFSGYDKGNSGVVIYPADGTFEDYAFWKYGTWSVLFELGYTHSPAGAPLEKMIKDNVPGMRLMFENSPKARAVEHAFRGKCDLTSRLLDLHLE